MSQGGDARSGDGDRAVGGLVACGVPAISLRVDDAGRVLQVSARTREVLGADVEGSLLATHLVQVLPDPGLFARIGAEPERLPLTLATAAGVPQTFECWLVRDGDAVVVVGAIDPVEYLRLCRELMELNQAASTYTRELQKANQELARASQMKDMFLGMAAHDLRSPLQVVSSYSAFLQEDLWDGLADEHRDLVSGIREATDYMIDIVSSFLDTALIHAGQLRIERTRVAPEALAQKALRVVEPLARRSGVPLRLHATGALPHAELDASKMQQALVNLLTNAIRHSPAGHEVVLALACPDGHLAAEVRDQGDGLAPEIERDLFRAFVHGKNRQTRGERGIGLGLAITRRIVEGHGGRIEVASQPGRGASFTVRVPLAAAPEP